MGLEDLRLNDRDVRKILKLAVRMEKNKYSKIDTNYSSAVTYQDLMKVAEDRGLNPDVVKGIVEHQNYRGFDWRGFGIENLVSATAGFFGGFIFGAGSKYFGSGITNPVVYGLIVTPIVDVIQNGLRRDKTFNQLIRDDAGTFAGQTLGCSSGYAIASLL